MPRSAARPNVTLRADVADDLLDRINSLARGLEECPREPLADWASEIRSLRRIVQDAVDDAEIRQEVARRYPRDAQRQKVYRAESLVADRPRVKGLARQRAYLDQVMATPWFRAYFADLTPEMVHLERLDNRLGAVAGSHNASRTHHRIALLDDVTDLTLLHELAHACHYCWYGWGRGSGGHDANFVGILLWLLVNHLGRAVGLAFAKGTVVAGVKLTQLHRQTRQTPVAPDYVRALVAQEGR